ncbi:RNA-binding ATPase activator esf2 [Gnomoniopsis sp. IMI 355080]|nr:RNA-binding ATPase activator esf2 [Gnomoniopsis sp. IMI 355080]
MASGKRNHFLDAEDSDDDIQDYNSEDELQKGGRVAKRRKTEDESDYEHENLSDNAASDSEDEDGGSKEHPPGEHENSDDEAEAESPDSSALPVQVPQVVKSLIKKNLVATEAAIKKSGVVYLSRVPPFMKPAKLRNLLEPYGKINRLFLAPQDPAAHKKRVKAGGNKKKLYTEGWVEFVRKKDAKRVCDLLNAQTIGGKKGNFYRDDIWTLLYLKGFKWHNLTEQIAAENAERSNRMMAEISRTTKENKEFVRNVEKGKVLEGIKTKRAQKKSLDDDPEAASKRAPVAKSPERARTFKQVTLAKKEATMQPSESRSVASRIF